MTIEQTVGELTLGGAVALDARRAKLGVDELTDLAQQFQIEIEGMAGEEFAWSTMALVFDVEFMGATEQRYSNLVRPTFSYGAILTAGPALVCAHVSEWAINDLGFYEGATVMVGILDPGGPTPVNGHIDLTFEGYGALREVESEDLSVG